MDLDTKTTQDGPRPISPRDAGSPPRPTAQDHAVIAVLNRIHEECGLPGEDYFDL
jgi:hypothetical protein